MSLRAQCAICSKHINPAYWVCLTCRRDNKLPDKFIDWPEWAKALKANEQERRNYEEEWSERMRQAKSMIYDDVTNDLEDRDPEPLSPFTGLHTRPGVLADGMADDPYETEAENRVYRKTHGMVER